MAPRSNRELWLALFAVLFITAIYLFEFGQQKKIPPAGDFFGHAIGATGFLLMLVTETLYSLRKRSRSARWGRMADWLRFHIFTGIVGPYLVLLHTSWKFNGLAGIVTLFTVIIVISGFIGRYIYTAIPRTADGVEMEVSQLERQLASLNNELQQAGGDQRSNMQQSKKISRRRDALQHQVNSLATTRRVLSLWHAIHIPIGLVLFTIAFMHAFAAAYYVTFLH